MKKNNSGITLISLIITIIVLLILSSIAIYSGIETVRSSKLTKFTTEMKIMQLKINDLYDSYTNDRAVMVNGIEYVGKGKEATEDAPAKPGIQEIGKDLSVAPQDKLSEASSGSEIDITTENGCRYYDAETIKALEIDGVENEFFVSVANRQVVSVDGFEYDGEKYYTLEQLPDGLYNVEYNKVDGNLSFEVTSEVIKGKGKLHVFNISYDKYVNKWQVRYRLKAEEGQEENAWNTTEEFTGSEIDIDVEKLGIYEVQVFHGDEIVSVIKEVEIEVRQGLKIGDYVNYIYDKNVEGYSYWSGNSNEKVEQISGKKWRIFNIYSDGTVDLIGDVSSLDETMNFSSATGYNIGVYILNDVCKELYSNNKLGLEARSINIEDIKAQLNEKGIENMKELSPSFGKIQIYKENKKYPNLYAKENGSGIDIETEGKTEEEIKELTKKDGIGTSCGGYSSLPKETISEAKNNLIVTNNYYNIISLSSYFKDYDGKNSKIADMIFETKTKYWLASRVAINTNVNYAEFGLYYLNNSKIMTDLLYNSNDIGTYHSYVSRPIVTIRPEIEITPVDNPDGSTEDNMHQIEGIY